MIPPVGLKAIVLTSASIVVTWSDTTLGRNQRITDNRFYTVKYNAAGSRRVKFVNATDLNVHIDDLRPNTEYEFSVKVFKGRRQSTWSLSVLNRTFEAGEFVSYLSRIVCSLEQNIKHHERNVDDQSLMVRRQLTCLPVRARCLGSKAAGAVLFPLFSAEHCSKGPDTGGEAGGAEVGRAQLAAAATSERPSHR